MSATLDMKKLSELLHAPTVISEGRQHPVEVNYIGDCDPYLMVESIAVTIKNATVNHDGDILVFLPGQGEILRCAELLKTELPEFIIAPLFEQCRKTSNDKPFSLQRTEEEKWFWPPILRKRV